MENNHVTTQGEKKIIVDTANVAFSVSRGETGEKKAYFENIQAAFTFFDRLALKKMFSIDFISDASLRYRIDYPDQLEGAMRDGKISQCPSRRTADSFIFEYLKKHPGEVIVVSNDNFRDYPDEDKKLAVFCKYHIVLGEFLCPDIERELETSPSRPKVARPAEDRPAKTKATTTRPAETKPAVKKHTETRSAETRLAETSAPESKPTKTRTASSIRTEVKPVVSKLLPTPRTAPTSPTPASNASLQHAASIILKAIQTCEANKKELLLTNVKTQILQADPSFDEGRYGFRKLKDILGELINKGYLSYAMKTDSKGFYLVRIPGAKRAEIPSQAQAKVGHSQVASPQVAPQVPKAESPPASKVKAPKASKPRAPRTPKPTEAVDKKAREVKKAQDAKEKKARAAQKAKEAKEKKARLAKEKKARAAQKAKEAKEKKARLAKEKKAREAQKAKEAKEKKARLAKEKKEKEKKAREAKKTKEVTEKNKREVKVK